MSKEYRYPEGTSVACGVLRLDPDYDTVETKPYAIAVRISPGRYEELHPYLREGFDEVRDLEVYAVLTYVQRLARRLRRAALYGDRQLCRDTR